MNWLTAAIVRQPVWLKLTSCLALTLSLGVLD